MRHRQRLVVLSVALLLAACAGQAAQPTATPAPAAPSPTLAPPATPLPPTTTEPTATPAPTASPEPTATPAPATAAATGELAGAELLNALHRGGYVLYFRHAATDRTQADRDDAQLENCQLQRNLNDKGRADARAIGAAFRSLGIPVGEVLSSRYCRARDTAELAFGRAVLTTDLSGVPSALRAARVEALRRLLAAPPRAGTNTVLVAHGFNISYTAQISLAEGEAAIFAALDDGGFRLVARVKPDDWAALADAKGQR